LLIVLYLYCKQEKLKYQGKNMDLLNFPYFITENQLILYITKIIALLFKSYLLVELPIKKSLKNKKNIMGIIWLAIILFSTIFGDFYWVLKLSSKIKIFIFSESFIYAIGRINDMFNVILHLSFSLFIETLISPYIYRKTFYKTIRSIIGIFFIIFSVVMAYLDNKSHLPYVFFAIKLLYFFILIIGIQTIYHATKIIHSKQIPHLLKHQLHIFIYVLFTPFLILKLATLNPLTFNTTTFLTNNTFMTLSTIFLTATTYFCTRKLVGTRFLNIKDHVETTYNFNFVKNFKKTLSELSHVTNLSELQHISQQFFHNAFDIPTEKLHLFIRDDEPDNKHDEKKRLTIEYFFSGAPEQQELINYLHQAKIFIRDEIEFSAFYDEQPGHQEAITFLSTINADLFLPIYDKKKLIAYIVIDYQSRPHRFYSNVERDEMLVFATYISSIINLVRNRNLDALLRQEKELKEELYVKHQEISQYKESIRSFFRNAQERKMGILFYKGRKFVIGNQAAQDFLHCDPNIQRGYPIVQTLKKLIKNVTAYQTTQVTMYKEDNKKLIITAIPNIENNDIIITLYYPDISDMIKMQADLLKDPSRWDYLLYLETTESGRLINQLIPGGGELLLNFKIDLLAIALNKKATLLYLPEEDLMETVELIHAMSLRKELSILTLEEPEKEYVHAIKLFGINPLMASGAKPEPLLEKLHTTGTLFIKNIHFLSLETQQALTEFIKYGAFTLFKSDHRIIADVRIICSTNQNLSSLVERGLFSKELFHELNRTTLHMPSLAHLSDQEFEELIENVTRQALKEKSLESMITLSEKEKLKLHEQCPKSLQGLRKKIYSLLLQKSEKHELNDILDITPAAISTEPELNTIIGMGKEALKDRKMMEYLWKTFHNQQKIAELLGVNRSSVNRRCKEFHLM
jgi:hypothetical protein